MSASLRNYSALGFVLLLLTYGMFAAPLGLSADSDSALLMRAAEHWLSTGDYIRSRSSGYPLYEALLVSLLLLDSPLLMANILSLLMAGAAAYLAWRIVRSFSESGAWLVPWLLLLHPLFLISSAEPMETILSVVLALALLDIFIRRPRLGVTHAVLAVFLILTRLDAALWVIAIAIVSMSDRRELIGWERIRPLIWLICIAGFTLTIYTIINQGFGFLNAQTMGFNSLQRRAIRALAGSVNALQLTGLLAIFFWLRFLRKQHVSGESWLLLDRLLVLVFVLYGLRFLALPDEVFYLTIPVVLLLVRLAILINATPIVFVLCLGMGIIQSLIAVSLFEREPGLSDRIVFRPALNIGPLIQDMRTRAAYAQLRNGAVRQKISCALFVDCPALVISHTAPFLTTSNAQRVVISTRYAYVLFSPRYRKSSDPKLEDIRTCAEEVVPGPAWRVWQPAINVYLVDSILKGRPLHCRSVNSFAR